MNILFFENCFKKYRLQEYHKADVVCCCMSTVAFPNDRIKNKSACMLHAAGVS